MNGKNFVSWNTMISRHVSLGVIKDAKWFFNKILWQIKDVITFNFMIDDGYAKRGRFTKILKIFEEMCMSFKFDMSCFMPLVLCVYNELKIFSSKTIALIF